MANYITGSSNYPYDNDLFPTGTGVNPNLFYVLDEIRSANGIVIQSGNTVVAEDVNVIYTVLNTLEDVLGYNPAGTYGTVANRLNFIQATGQSYLSVTGGSILGPVTFTSGSNVIIDPGASLITNLITGNNLTIASTVGGLTLGTNNGNITIDSNGQGITLTGQAVIISTGGLSVQTPSVYISGDGVFFLGNNNAISIGNSLVPTSSFNIGSTGVAWGTLYVNNIVSTGVGGLSGYVATTGGSMNGIFTLGSGSKILNSNSGTNSLGSVAEPFGWVSTKTLNVTNISGMSPVTFLSNIEFVSGSTIAAASSGINIGSASNPIATIYATTIVGATGFNLGSLVSQSGSGMFGNLNMTGTSNIVLGTGSAVVPSVSGTSSIGASGNPIGNVYTNAINNSPIGHMVFNEQATGTGYTYFLSHTPANDYAMIFANGVYQAPGFNYVFSGNALQFTGNIAPTAPIYAGFYVY